MVVKVLPSHNEMTFNDKIKSKPNTGKTKNPQGSGDELLSSPNRILILGCLIYFTYSMSIAVDSQFLSLYYKSKGFDGTTLGVLYSLTPLTTFLTVPVWGMLTGAAGVEKLNCNGNNKSSIYEKDTNRPFQIICMNIVIATTSQISLAILDKPIYMMIAITVVGMFQSPAKPMLDGIIMDHMDDRSNFGKVRFFSILGSGFGTNMGGRLLTMVQNSVANDNLMVTANHSEKPVSGYFWDCMLKLSSGFNPLFFARFILTIPPIICIRQLQIAATTEIQNVKNSISNNGTKSIIDHHFKNDMENSTSILSISRDVAKHCFKDRNHFLFFLCILIAGASGGVSDAFSYPRYQEFGCSTTHMGQSRLISSCAGAMMFWYSGHVTRHLGIQNVLCLSMICAGVRFSLLKRMDHPHYIYLIDLIRSTTYGAFWSSSTIYASQIGPRSFQGTVLLLLNGIYNGIGRSAGAIFGGKFQAMLGTNNLFLCCARINYVFAFVMGILHNRESKSHSSSHNSWWQVAAKKGR